MPNLLFSVKTKRYGKSSNRNFLPLTTQPILNWSRGPIPPGRILIQLIGSNKFDNQLFKIWFSQVQSSTPCITSKSKVTVAEFLSEVTVYVCTGPNLIKKIPVQSVSLLHMPFLQLLDIFSDFSQFFPIITRMLSEGEEAMFSSAVNKLEGPWSWWEVLARDLYKTINHHCEKISHT